MFSAVPNWNFVDVGESFSKQCYGESWGIKALGIPMDPNLVKEIYLIFKSMCGHWNTPENQETQDPRGE